MKNKHFMFSISLAISIAVIVILSLFIDNGIFDGIAQAITIPFVLFTFVNCASSIAEEVVSTCRTKLAIINEMGEKWDYYKKILESQLEGFHKYDNPQNESQIEINKLIDQKQDRLDEAKRTINNYADDYSIFNEIIVKCEKNIILQVFYVITLTVLIVSMMISPILAPYFSFIPTTALTLLSLFFAIMETLVKNKISNTIFEHMYSSKKKVHQEKSTPNN